MLEVYNIKKGCNELAKCRHCSHFHWSASQSWMGYCSRRFADISNSTIACSNFDYRYRYLIPKRDIVQLNLFQNEKSI